MNTPPVAQTQDLVVLLGNTINGFNLFTATDADGDPITKWRFVDTFGGDKSGYFTVDGIRRDANSLITLNTNELGTLEYLSGSIIGRETIRVQAFDGQDWSKWAEFFIYSAVPNVTVPLLTVFPFHVVAYEKINVVGWLQASDPDGWPIDRYLFRDRKVGGGYFQLDGVKLQEGTGNGIADWILVEAKDLPRFQYVGALNGQTEIIDVRARDTQHWSLLQTIAATTHANLYRPQVQEKLFQLPIGVTDKMTKFVNVTDADNNSIKSYRLFDTSNSPGSAYFSVFGVEQPFKQWIELTPQQFRNSTISSATSGFRTDHFRVQAFDGKFWSPISTISIKTAKKPTITSRQVDGLGIVVANSHFDFFNLGQYFDVDAGELFFQQFQVVDRRANFGPYLQPGGELSGHVVFRPSPDSLGSQSDNRIHTFSPSEFNELQLKGGFATGRDEIFVRGSNGKFWSDWERLIFSTDTGWNTAGASWLSFNPPGGNVTFYSFGGFFRQDDRLTGGVQATEYLSLSFPGRQAFRRQFQRLNDLVENMSFVEVPDNYVHPNGSPHGLIRIQGWVPQNFQQPLPCAFSYTPTDHSDPLTLQEGGDIWITHVSPFFPQVTFCGGGNWDLDTVNGTMVAREILSAVGIGGPATNDSAFSLSRGPDPRGQAPPGYNGGVARSFGLWDIHALQAAYGADVDFNNGNNVYDFNNYWQGDFNFVDNIYDSGGVDTLDLSASNADGNVTIIEGEVSQVGGARIGITYGTVIENIITGNGNMVVRGNQASNIIRTGSGNDTIQGFGGDDFLFGGAGDDTYIYSLADGHNTIDEERSAGRDRILVERSETLRLDDLGEDVTFRRLGRDLIIDFTVNGNYTEGRITIKDQQWGRSRIETLNIFGVDVDLTRIYAMTNTTGSSFDIDFVSPQTVFGHLVTPVV